MVKYAAQRARFEQGHRRHLAALRRYVARHGWKLPPRGKVVDGCRLSEWVKQRRIEYLRGKLAPWIEEELQAIPGWTWTPTISRYKRTIDLLHEYVATHGWDGLQNRKVVIDGCNLSAFVTDRRHARRHGLYIDPWVVAALEAIPGWSWEPIEDQHREKIELLEILARHHGRSASVPSEIVLLGAWIRLMKQRPPRSRALRAALEALPGWRW